MNKPLRVLCVFSILDHGGSESMCMNLYRHIDREIVQFDFVKHTPDKGAFEEEILSMGGRIFEAPTYKLYNTVSYCLWWKKFLLAHPEYRIIHGHYFTISAVYFCVAKRLGRITVGHIHASAMSSKIKDRLVHRISKYTDIALACSEMAGKWAYGDRQFTVLNNAIDIDRFRYNPETRATYRRELGLGDSLTLGTVANLSTVKNPMGLIDIFCAVKKRCPDVHLIWVGEGSCREEIEARLQQEGLTEAVHLLGTRNDVSDVLQAMDVFLLPSFNEGLGIAAIESQAAGLETFCSDTVPREAGVTHLCHFLPLDNTSMWVDAICQLNRNYRRENTEIEIGNRGFDIRHTTKWLQEFYLSLSY